MRQAGSVVKKRKRYYVVYRGPDKKQRWEGGFETKSEAQERLTELLGEIQAGSYVEPTGKTFSAWSEEWLRGRVNVKGKPGRIINPT